MSSALPESNNQAYYDEFSASYENERHHGYHVFIDELETALVKRYLKPDLRILELGCGTGLLMKRLLATTNHAVGVDLSRGMLRKAHARNLQVLQATATEIPFLSASFDIVYSFKVLAHVENIRGALQECARVLKPGGLLIAEFYNPLSLRGLIKKWKKPTAISHQTTDESVFTRYDTLTQIRSYLPASLKLQTYRGIRIWTPASWVHKWPVVGTLVRGLERLSADLPGVRRFGGFLAIVAQKEKVDRLLPASSHSL